MQKSKVILNSPKIAIGSRADKYWNENGFLDYSKFIRPNLDLPKSLSYGSNPDLLRTKFGISEIGFGNWVTNEDRFNYVNGLIISLYDLNKLMNLDYFLGLGLLSVSFGARGAGSALAHYESQTKIINVTRYHRGDESKLARFVATGGMGSFAHEYGHFLDYVGGEYVSPHPQVFAVTGGRSISRSRMPCTDRQRLRVITNDLLEKIIWKVPNKTVSAYYTRLAKFMMANGIESDYLIRRNELFARWFEAWVSFKLNSMNIKNKLLAQAKYSPLIYPTENEVREVDKLFQDFMKEFKSGYFYG